MSRPLWVAVLVAAQLALLGVGLLFGLQSGWGVTGIVVAVGALVAAARATTRLRPKSNAAVGTIVVGIALAMASLYGAPSLWMAAFGSSQDCAVLSRSRDSSRSGSAFYSHQVRCGDRTLDVVVRDGYLPEVTTLVVDRTRVLGPARPDDVSPLRAWSVALGAVLALGHVIVLPRLTRKPATALKRRFL
ncbi:hypothetical protein [Saccharothrix coeruleofusca]|uniref:Uncharacterized protein n=1 Tax=Saccharothrix coeruleofusca TaxID=33919 RepID=A0A918AQ93_9PSEU|nr:hypothetical protein [Saccharothrix coeruleofusca]GGP69565.1 hypothetical protein GCM10010185_48030 [Saccharothrix coeruleofusca]